MFMSKLTFFSSVNDAGEKGQFKHAKMPLITLFNCSIKTFAKWVCTCHIIESRSNEKSRVYFLLLDLY